MSTALEGVAESTPHNTYHFRVEDVHDVSKSRRKGMDVALEMGFVRADATKIAVVISELARNILAYAQKGSITIIIRNDPGSKQYIKIIADDEGPGINNVDQAMNDGYTTSNGLGLGLSGSQRLVDEFSIHSEPGRGTTITAIKWL
jgi:serine/threonine-protein kinase RsbT